MAPGATPGDGLIDVPSGLTGVAVTTTELGDVRGAEGFYHYRGYPAPELARQHSLEDVWYLVLHGQLPTPDQARDFATEVSQSATLPPDVVAMVGSLVAGAPETEPMRLLLSALPLATSIVGMPALLDADPATRRRDAIQVAAWVPHLLTTIQRLRSGHDQADPMSEPASEQADSWAPRPELSHAGNYLYRLTGQLPTAQATRAIEQYLIATIDHGFNASTFTARVVASTGADLGAAVAAALGALSGPLHGGAPSRALDALDAVGSPERARDWVRGELAAGRRIMGFGHAVYRTDDPRSVLLHRVAQTVATTPSERARLDLAEALEAEALATLAEHRPDRPLRTNVEFYAGVVMELCGIPRDMFTATFAMSRVIGWTANILEQAAEGKIIRPAARYLGPPPPRAS